MWLFNKCKCGRGVFRGKICNKCIIDVSEKWDSEHTFVYKQRVKVVGGFYKGQEGVVMQHPSVNEYTLRFDDNMVETIWRGNLEAID